MVYRNATAFDVSAVRYSKTYTKRWKTDAKKFRDINLPFMRPGLFQVDFVSDRSEITLDVYAQDCLMEVFLDGKRIQDRLKKCRYCYTYHPVPRHRCKQSRFN